MAQASDDSSVAWDELTSRASDVRTRARAPYSGFAVGACVLTTEGRSFVGCNVESRSYGLTICAERHAVGAMIAAVGPAARIRAVAIATDAAQPTPPCGACREVLHELAAPGCEVRSVTLSGPSRTWRLDELLPAPFELDD